MLSLPLQMSHEFLKGCGIKNNTMKEVNISGEKPAWEHSKFMPKAFFVLKRNTQNKVEAQHLLKHVAIKNKLFPFGMCF